MGSFSLRADDSNSVLWRQCEQFVSDEDCRDLGKGLQWELNFFENELRLMRIFLECVKRWSDLEDVLQLGFLLRRIEAKLEETENMIIHLPPLLLLERPPKRSLILKIWEKKKTTLQRNLSKLGSMTGDLNYDLRNLHGEIKLQAFDSSWSSQSFEFRFDYDRWKEFAKFIDCCLGVSSRFGASSKAKFEFEKESESSLKKQFEVGRVAITAALQLCHWWSTSFYEEKH